MEEAGFDPRQPDFVLLCCLSSRKLEAWTSVYHRREMLEALTLGTVMSGPSSRDIWELGLMANEWGGGTEGNEV